MGELELLLIVVVALIVIGCASTQKHSDAGSSGASSSAAIQVPREETDVEEVLNKVADMLLPKPYGDLDDLTRTICKRYEQKEQEKEQEIKKQEQDINIKGEKHQGIEVIDNAEPDPCFTDGFNTAFYCLFGFIGC